VLRARTVVLTQRDGRTEEAAECSAECSDGVGRITLFILRTEVVDGEVGPGAFF